MGANGVDVVVEREALWLGAALTCGLAGFAIASARLDALDIAVVAACLVISLVSLRTAIVGVVLSMFLTRLSIHVGGVDVRPEHVMTIALAVRLAARGRLQVGKSVAAAVAALGAYLTFAFAALTFAPDPRASLHVLGWLVLDVLLVVALLNVPEYYTVAMRVAIATSAMVSVAACVLWALAATDVARVAVQHDTAYGGYAPYVLSYEANTLASSVAIWAVVAAIVRWPARGLAQVVLHVITVGAILATHTRAALIAYVAAIVVLACARRAAPFVALFAVASVFIAGTAVVSLRQGTSLQELVAKFSNPVDFQSGSGLARARTSRTAVRDLHGMNIVFGLGTNTYGQRHLDPTRPGTQAVGYLGSSALQIVYDGGIIALVLIGFVVASVVRRNDWRVWLPMLLVYGISSAGTSIYWFSITWILVAIGLQRRPVADVH